MAKPAQHQESATADTPREALAQALKQRSVRMIEMMIDHAPSGTLRYALEAPSAVGGVAALISELATVGMDVSAIDPLADAFARGAAHKAAILEDAGGAYTTAEVAEAFNVTRQAIDKRRRRGSLLAVPDGSGNYLYPQCQFTSHGEVVPNLARVLRAFNVESAWTRLEVLIQPAQALNGRSVIDALRAGDVDEAEAVVRAYAAD